MQKKLLFLLVLILPIIAGGGSFFYFKAYLLGPKESSSSEKFLVELVKEQTFKSFATELEKSQIINSATAFNILARIRGDDKQIKAGEYELSPAMTPLQILIKLIQGDVVKRFVTIKEGSSIREIGAIVEKAGLVLQEEFDKELSNPLLLQEVGLKADNFEGYLFPSTYNFTRRDTAKSIIMTMYEQGKKIWTEEKLAKLEEFGGIYSKADIVTLASIIEKESGNFAEQGRVSSVFHNRLRSGMPLQSDPTVVYLSKNYQGKITKDMLREANPYNTYMNLGLPPGPICNPGENAIKAALSPEVTDYYYFVADGKGGHVFSKSLDEHNQAVAEYRKIVRDYRDSLELENENEIKIEGN